MSDPTRRTLADLEASEAETGAGVPFAEVEAKIEAAIERAERGSSADQRRKAAPGL